MRQTPYRRRIIEEWYQPPAPAHTDEDLDHEEDELERAPQLLGDEELEHADLEDDINQRSDEYQDETE